MHASITRSLAAIAAVATLAVSPAAAQTLYSQSDLVTNPGVAVGGADVSALQVSAGNNLLGLGANSAFGLSVADNFTITGNAWTISGFRFFAYQTGSPSDLSSPFTSLGWQIWSGRPGDAGASVVAGNLATNSLTYTGFSGIYRTTETPLTATNRPVMLLDATTGVGGVTLGAGTYWLQWTVGGVGTSLFVPPVTFAGLASSGDAMQLNGSWNPALDGSRGVELPFDVFGEVNCNVVPEPSTYALMATGLIGMAGVARRRRATA